MGSCPGACAASISTGTPLRWQRKGEEEGMGGETESCGLENGHLNWLANPTNQPYKL